VKFLLLSSILVSLLFSDEISRIESIVKDIAKLRQKYELCQDELDKIVTAPKQCEVNEMELKARHQEILFLQNENEELAKKDASKLLHVEKISKEKDKALEYLRAENKRLNEQIKTLKTEQNSMLESKTQKINAKLKYMDKISQEKDKALKYLRSENKRLTLENEKTLSLTKEIAKLKNELAEAIKNRDESYKMHDKSLMALEKEVLKLKDSLKAPLPKTHNKEEAFAHLKMKEGYEYLQGEDKIDWSASGTYRLKHDSKIYDAIDGKVVDTWEKQRSFTSAYYQDGWVKVTGYFVDKKWQSAKDKSLWIKRKDAYRR
jgi:chromosome segregation ATPase